MSKGRTYHAGKTYSLFGEGCDSSEYYSAIKGLADRILRRCPDEMRLLSLLRKSEGVLLRRLSGEEDRSLMSFIMKALRDSLSVYTRGVKRHLRELPASRRFDETLAAKEKHYHIYMIEIELVNRIYRESFRKSRYRIALLPHCLRDFRPGCRSVPGDIEARCGGCTDGCFINRGSLILKEFGIEPYIAVEMDQEGLFAKLKARHPDIGALGVACVPELARGMRLCIRLGIHPVGVPLDANRCARWMGRAHESSFNLDELKKLL